jgi:hypothetical protein
MASTQAPKRSLMDDLEAAPAPVRREAGSVGVADRRKTYLVIAVFVVALGALSYVLWTSISAYRNDPARAAFTLTLMDIETREVFHLPIKAEEHLPFTNPKTGHKTLYPVEACYWTKDGKAKLEPTLVVLEETMGKPGPTKCPDCGRIVRHMNPQPPDSLMQEAWDAAHPGGK